MNVRLKDVRLRRLISDLRHPSTKKGMNPRSLEYLRAVLMDKRRSVLFASFPRCGSNWVDDVISYAVIKHFKGEFKVVYSDGDTLKQSEQKPFILTHPADSRSAGKPKIRDMFPELDTDCFFHTHGFWKQSPLWGLDEARTVFVVRNIPASLYSYLKTRTGKYESMQDCIDDGVLDRAIRFYNSWGEFCLRDGADYRIYKYEDLRADPFNHFSDMIEYVLRMPLPEAVVREAIDYYSFAKQKEREYRFSSDESKHFHFKGKTDYRDDIPAETMEKITKAIRTGLVHSFGYDYGQ